ncbi:MAG: sigma-70 family RNA polymerase sigma factor [Actinobacteria bacterium]|nr:sigma-70 family RNA polymerase sigma factor [Actinomycetota bacterium]
MSASAVATRPTDGDRDDRDLVAGVRAGDDRAFELLFQRYQPLIAAYVRGKVRDHGRAEDITQEVFMSALRRIRAQTEREILFKPWIFEIAKNKCIDAFRRTRNVQEVSLEARHAVGADEHGRLADQGATPDAAVEGKVAIDNLCGAFGGLSAVHHDILVLRELDGLSYREIGDRLGMSRPAVESTLFRARKRLSAEYEELVSGERCLRVQRIVDGSGGRSPGLRDQRRMARHLAHCQPCRRYAALAGIDLGTVARPGSAAARVAAFLPLPAFLRRRWGGDEPAALLGHGGSASQWSANLATIADPGVVSGWTKAVATAATVAVAGMGAGAAFDGRIRLDGGGAAQPAPARAQAPRLPTVHDAARAPAVALAPAPAAKRGAQLARAGRPAKIAAGLYSPAAGLRSSAPGPPRARPSQAEKQSGRTLGLGSDSPPPSRADANGGARGESPAQGAGAVERVLGATGDVPRAPAVGDGAAPDAAPPATPALTNGVTAPAVTSASPTDDAVASATAGATPPTAPDVSPTRSTALASTPTSLDSLGG